MWIMKKVEKIAERKRTSTSETIDILDQGKNCCNDVTYSPIDIKWHIMQKDKQCNLTSQHSMPLKKSSM